MVLASGSETLIAVRRMIETGIMGPWAHDLDDVAVKWRSIDSHWDSGVDP